MKLRNGKNEIKPNQNYGKWITKDKLGRGGNGEVWECSDSTGQSVAIKFLTKVKPGAYKRFISEVEILQKIQGVPGILPLIDSHLPALSEKRRAWYAMPLAKPIEKWAEGKPAASRVARIAEAATTMAILHQRKIFHRDLKLANLVFYADRCHIVDFGLVTFPGKQQETQLGENIGPLWTMAPEVRRHGAKADPMPADVYSLAKSLWGILKTNYKTFDGQYINTYEIGIKSLFDHEHVTPLENLLTSATSHTPADRLSMTEFAVGLARWLASRNDFMTNNPLEWKNALDHIFPIAIPQSASWDNPAEIAAILNVIGGRNVNHMFYPTGGGNDLEGCLVSANEDGYIELNTGIANIMKPHKLYFESCSNDYQWNYFRLEIEEVAPTGVYEEDRHRRSRGHEEVTEIYGGAYEDISCYFNDDYMGEPLPESARRICWWYGGGAFVIFQKSSFYNLAHGDLDAYSGRHNKMTTKVFRDHVCSLANSFRKGEIDLRKRPRPEDSVNKEFRRLSEKLLDDLSIMDPKIRDPYLDENWD